MNMSAQPTSETVSRGRFALQGGKSSGCMERAHACLPAWRTEHDRAPWKLSVFSLYLPVRHEQTPRALSGGPLWPSAATGPRGVPAPREAWSRGKRTV